MKRILKSLLKAVLPHGLILLWQRRKAREARFAQEAARAQYHAQRKEQIAIVEDNNRPDRTLDATDYENVVAFLVQRGLPEHHVREGSVPPDSLRFVRDHAVAGLDGTRPLRALHIGNFVGVSLAYLTATLVQQQPESLMISVDPNVTHRGIAHPQSHVLALLSACGLQSNSLVLAGYSGKKSVSNDATVFDGYDPATEFYKEAATEHTLQNLGSISSGSFDLVFLDGNHEATYLVHELKSISPLLREGAYVVLDDVDAAWAEIRDVFLKISEFGLEPVAANGRVGIARLRVTQQTPLPSA
jgi:hypothetical protein